MIIIIIIFIIISVVFLFCFIHFTGSQCFSSNLTFPVAIDTASRHQFAQPIQCVRPRALTCVTVWMEMLLDALID